MVKKLCRKSFIFRFNSSTLNRLKDVRKIFVYIPLKYILIYSEAQYFLVECAF